MPMRYARGVDPRELPAPKRHKSPIGPVPTLGQLRQDSCWLWVNCERWGCFHYAPMAIAPLIIWWGETASSDLLRQRARCSKCGKLGATLTVPSWVNGIVGIAPFPVEQRP